MRSKTFLKSTILQVIVATTITYPPQISVADSCVEDCKKVIEAADLSIKELQELIKIKDVYIQFQEEQLIEQRAALSEEIEANSKWYKNPTITTTLGILAGMVTGVIITNGSR